MAFQLVDDLMDYGGEQAVMGKPAGSDIKEGQATFPLLAVLPRLSPAERRDVHEVFRPGGGASTDAIERVVDLVRERGGIDATRCVAAEYAASAREALSLIPGTPAREVLEAAVDYVLARDR
jgi:geranylgeranyl pyrophosphate synthase